MTATYLPSLDNPGFVWKLDTYKPNRGPAVATATEGKLTDHAHGQSFTTRLFTDRGHRVLFNGNNTAKNRANALGALLADLEDRGWVDKGYGVCTD